VFLLHIVLQHEKLPEGILVLSPTKSFGLVALPWRSCLSLVTSAMCPFTIPAYSDDLLVSQTHQNAMAKTVQCNRQGYHETLPISTSVRN
jgi:hypothetical protein